MNLKTDPDPAKKPWILRYRSGSRSERLVNFKLQKSELTLSFAIPWIHLDTYLDPQKCLYLDPDLYLKPWKLLPMLEKMPLCKDNIQGTKGALFQQIYNLKIAEFHAFFQKGPYLIFGEVFLVQKQYHKAVSPC